MNENLLSLKHVLAGIFLVYLAGLAVEALKRRRANSLFVLAACAGGTLVPLAHAGLLQADYTILLGIGVVAGIVHGLQRAWDFLGQRFLGKMNGLLEPICFLLLGLCALPYYYAANQGSFRDLSPKFVKQAAIWREHIASLAAADRKVPSGVIFRLDFDPEMQPSLKEQAFIYLPLALKEFIPGRLFIFDGTGVPHAPMRNDLSFPGTRELVAAGNVRHFLLSRDGQVTEPSD